MSRCVSIFLTLLATGFAAWSDGLETFDNENAPPAVYATSSFVGNNGVTWNYELCRDASADSGAYEINGAGLMFNPSSTSKLYSSAIPGGIRDFSVKLRKGFTGAGLRQVELFVNGVSKGLSESFDDTQIRTFSVQNINVAGNVVIELRNAKVKQVVIDDLSWTSLTGGDDPNISFSSPFDFGEISSGSAATQTLTILNTGTSKTLNVTGFSPVSGDTGKFSAQASFPISIAPNNGSQAIKLVYTPGNVTGAMHSAVFNFNSNDPGDGAAPITLTGKTPPGMLTISNINTTHQAPTRRIKANWYRQRAFAPTMIARVIFSQTRVEGHGAGFMLRTTVTGRISATKCGSKAGWPSRIISQQLRALRTTFG